MRKMNKWLLGSGLMGLVLFLSGCVQTKDGQPTGEGWVYKLLVQPMSNLITYLVNNFDWNYGWAIIFITIVVRLIIMPLGLHQSRSSMRQTEKMQYLKPQIDAAQAVLKEATTREEQMEAQANLQKVYKENGMSMTGGIGCLPLLIQMPVFSALFYAARYTPGINDATFLGVNLGKPSMVFVVLAGVAYLLQGYISMIGVPDEQKKTMRSMLIVSPLMIVFMSFSSPAGVTLYWVVGGIFSCIQTFITNIILKPRIKAQIQEEFRKNPPKQVIVKPVKDVTPKKAEKQQLPKSKSGGRNAGKQQRKK